jgi:hypothetical protein
MSESNRSTLATIYPRWKAIYNHIKEYSAPGGAFSDDIYEYRHGAGVEEWQDRIDKQLLPIHIVAFLLLPINRTSCTTLLPGLLAHAKDYISSRLTSKGYYE